MVIISACLAGKKCRYDGRSKPNPEILALIESGAEYMLVCPECEGGLAIPREPSEIVGGTGADVLDGCAKVLGRDGSNRTNEYLTGAGKVLAAAKKAGAEKAYLKSKSPSCGKGRIYDGSFSGKLIPGNGVLAELLERNGIQTIETD